MNRYVNVDNYKEMHFHSTLINGQFYALINSSSRFHGMSNERLQQLANKCPKTSIANAARLELIARNPICPACHGTTRYQGRPCIKCNQTGLR